MASFHKFHLKVFHARGFGVRWCDCIHSLLISGFSLVLINGQLGAPFGCKRGLRQEDSFSPYLFILGIDVLSCMLSLAYEGGLVQELALGI